MRDVEGSWRATWEMESATPKGSLSLPKMETET